MSCHTGRVCVLALLVSVLGAAPSVAQVQLLDDFASGTHQPAWVEADGVAQLGTTIGVPGLNTVYDASGGSLQLTSSLPLPAVSEHVLSGAAWASSGLGGYDDGRFSARVRIDNDDTNALLFMRSGAMVENFYSFSMINIEDVLVIDRFVNGQGVPGGLITTPFTISSNTDYMIQAEAVGTRLSMKVWEVGTPEPASPQLLTYDATHATGSILIGILNQSTNNGVPGTGGVLSGSFDDVTFAPASPRVQMYQLALGGPLMVENDHLLAGRTYRNLYSFDTCGTPGSGPILGLCFSSFSSLAAQLTTPLGVDPFHFQATDYTKHHDPIPFGLIPPGVAIDAVVIDVTDDLINCWSGVVRYQPQ